MRARLRIGLFGAAIVAAAACGSAKKTHAPTLVSGDYAFTADTATSDTCWPDTNVFPPTGIGLGFTLASSASSGDATFTLTPASNVAPFLPSMTGVRAVNAIETTGTSTIVISTGCSIVLGAHGTGTVTADDTIELDLEETISGDTVASNGAPSSCAAFQTTSYQMIPFPTLQPATNGSCAFGLSGPLARS